jgi:two-component system chemotaxis response regulator CheB
MFSAVGEVYGPNATAVVFSGMGRDGVTGSRDIAERSGTIFVQDAESSAVWGMPRAVAEAGLASAVLPPADLARRIVDYSRDRAWK